MFSEKGRASLAFPRTSPFLSNGFCSVGKGEPYFVFLQKWRLSVSLPLKKRNVFKERGNAVLQTFFGAYRESREKGFDKVESLGRGKGKPVSRKVPLPLPTPHPILSQDFRAYRISVHGFPCFSGKGASALFLFGKSNGKAGRDKESPLRKVRARACIYHKGQIVTAYSGP